MQMLVDELAAEESEPRTVVFTPALVTRETTTVGERRISGLENSRAR